MERHQAQLILEHIDIIRHFAKGGIIEFQSRTCDGHECAPTPVFKGIIINCLPRYRKVDGFIGPLPKKYCSRWCPDKLTKGKEMITATSARKCLEEAKEDRDGKLTAMADEVMDIINANLEVALKDCKDSFEVGVDPKYGPCTKKVGEALMDLGYKVAIDHSRSMEASPYLFTISF